MDAKQQREPEQVTTDTKQRRDGYKQHSSDFSVVRDYIRNSWPTQPVHGFPAADANDALHRIEEQLEAERELHRTADAALEAVGGEVEENLRSALYWSKKCREAEEQVQALETEKVELELACDHHRMFWQKAEERERGLKEQLEALRVVLETAYHYYPKDTPMSDSMRDALNPARES